MDELALSEQAEEALAALWLEEEQHGPDVETCLIAGDLSDGKPLAELAEAGLVARLKGPDRRRNQTQGVRLTSKGRAEAASVIRRERLAERLLTDVLQLDDLAATETACKFEHLLRRGIDDEICSLLGHPRYCPHGSPIPPGDCCRSGTHAPKKVISALADLSPGQSGVVAYVHSHKRELVQRLLSMGVVPGTAVSLVQSAPSYVIQLGQAQVAVDHETAKDIYVRVTSRRPRTLRRRGWGPLGRLRLRRGRG